MRSLTAKFLSLSPDLHELALRHMVKRKPTQCARLGLESLEERLLMHAGEDPFDHYHPQLAIFLDGQQTTIPALIGVDATGVIDNPHTHDSTGLVHIHPLGGQPLPQVTVGDFFRVWRTNAGLAGNNPDAIFNQNQILDRVADANHVVRFFVNGVANDQFENFVPIDGDQMIISYETVAAAGAPALVPIDVQTMAAGKTLQVPLDGFDAQGGPVTYSFTSSNPNVTGEIPTSNPSLRFFVGGVDLRGNGFSGNIVIQLYQDLAPATVARISQLVNSGFYTGVTFHRIINEFMAQGGDPTGTGSGGSGVKFDDEFTTQLTFTGYGQLAMANSGDDTNDSQFFITDQDLRLTQFTEATKSPPQHLNFNHTIFGQVVEGFDVFQKVITTEVNGERPENDVVINSATIFNDLQNGVLRLSAPAGFTGSSTITVTATDGQGLTAQRSFLVNVVADSVNDRPFLGPIANLSTNENASVVLPLPATDLENDTLTFVVRNPDNFFLQPANATVVIDQSARTATITPATNFVGTINLLVGVRDQTDRNGNFILDEQSEFDTQRITLAVNAAHSTISGRKFEDRDGDGTDDGGTDPGLAGWTIQLDIGADGTVDATTTTAANGTYSFTGLVAGTYRVREVTQAGFVQTTGHPNDIALDGSNAVSGVDFGNFQRIKISGRKFHDIDGNGIENGDAESGLEGWTIELDRGADGSVDATTTTAADGTYSFVDLGPGTYRVREVLQTGWVQTTSNPADITASSGSDATGVDFGNFELITISGRKFEDLDGDGTDDAGTDPGLQNWTIFLDENLNDTLDDGEPSVLTAADGTYQFAGLGPGIYRVREVLQAGWTQTTANSPDLVAMSGANVAAIDFGNFHRPTISGRKVEDILGDGFTADDTPLAGWTIELFRDNGDGQFDPASDTIADGAVTDASGRYQFLNVTTGTYFVREIPRDGWIQTGGPAFYQVDVSGAVSGEMHTGHDFGNFEKFAILGFKFNDLDGDGSAQAGEFGLAGWTIFLDDNDNGILDGGERSTTTQGFGNYNFPDLGPGTYRVREVLQPGFVQVSPNPDDIVARSGQDVLNVDFFNFQLITIRGVKFHDRDGNGVLDATDPSQAGWTIFLDDNDNGMLDNGERSTTTADGTGEYSFANLGPGTYRVREVVQPGWVQVTANPVIVATSGQDRSDVNFGNFRLIAVSGHKFEDHDGDGVKDADDQGLEGWTIFIDSNDNGTLDSGESSAVTDVNGNYTLSNVGPGTLAVRELLQSGFQQTTPVRNIVSTGGQDVSGVDFGNFRLISISGEKFNDLNGNGTRENGENGLQGWVIFIDTNGNGSLDAGELRATTDTDGRYTLSGVGPGTHRVREAIQLQPGWMQTTPNPADIVASSGLDVSGINFGNFQLITISGQKFEDTDGDGVKDTGEPGLPGWTIFLDGNDNGVLDDGERSVVTGTNGQYGFSDVGPGEYRVREVLQTGWTRTLPSMTTTTVHIAESGRNLSDVDFGNFRLVTISGRKFLDLNGDGVRDDGEPGLPGWTIFLDTNDNAMLDPGELSAVTDATGAYTISGVGPGTYRIEEVSMDGFQRTLFTSINVTSGMNQTGVDVGNLPELTAQIIRDPFEPDETALMVAGSNQDDRLSVTCGKHGQLFAHINGQQSGPFEPTGHVIMLAFEGDDQLLLARCVTLPGQLDGSDGNDTMRGARGDDMLMGGDGDDKMRGRGGDDHMEGGDGENRMRGGRGDDMLRGGADNDRMNGGRGHDMMIGMEGDDVMVGGRGRDLMIGGDGADRMIGDRRDSDSHHNGSHNQNAGDRNGKGRHQDIVIGGTTDYDVDDEALQAILAEWTSRQSYNVRVANLRDGSGSTSALNQDFFLDSFTVQDDGIADRIRGGRGLDWFFASEDGPTQDKLRGHVRTEIVDSLD